MKKVYLYILSLFPILLLRAGVFRLLFLTNFSTDSMLITNLLGLSLTIPFWITALFGLINMLLLWLTVKNLFNSRVAFLSSFIYGVSPWTAYMEYSASIYVIFLTFLLLLIFGLTLLKKGRIYMGYFLSLIGFLALVYGSFLSWFVLPFLLWGFHWLGYLKLNKRQVLSIVLLIMPLLFFSFKNYEGLLTTAKNQITLFSDVGLINTVNVLQGDNRGVRPQFIARLTENRYSYLSLHLISSSLNTVNPINYFTPQYKMLNFSINPAIFVGFMVPFFIGFGILFKQLQKRIVALCVFSLFIPAFFSKASPDFARMILSSPIIFLVISIGLMELWHLKRRRWFYLTVFLVSIQFSILMIDLFVREPWRLYQLTGI